MNWDCNLFKTSLETHETCTIIITGRNKVVAKVIFLHLFVILYTGGGGGVACLRQTPPGPDPPEQTPPGSRHPLRSRHPSGSRPLWADPSGSRHPPPKFLNFFFLIFFLILIFYFFGDLPPSPPRSWLRHMVNERPVRILLECNLVTFAVACNVWNLVASITMADDICGSADFKVTSSHLTLSCSRLGCFSSISFVISYKNVNLIIIWLMAII